MRKTKIICTIGPAVETKEQILRLIDAGMNVARLNFSHGTHEHHQLIIQRLKEARKLRNVPLAILLDTKGPEIRVGQMETGEILFSPGDLCLLVKEDQIGTKEQIPIRPYSALEGVQIGTNILFVDGYLISKVVSIDNGQITIEMENGGKLQTGKGVNIPNVSLNLPAVTEKDAEDLRFGCKQGIDLIAASFVRSAEHILTIQKIVEEEGHKGIQIIAKIENREGVEHVDSILQVADGIMIARGDLGVEVPLSQVPRLQKAMIRKCYEEGKTAVTATQMLESMIHHPRPTRAEVSDVANAIYDSTSAVMLSAESAIGQYPIRTVETMCSIVREAEDDFNYQAFFNIHRNVIYNDVSSCIALAAVKTAYSSSATAIFAFSAGGTMARLLSRLRPRLPIIAMTPHETCYHQLAISWGVIPLLHPPCASFEEAFQAIQDFALEKQLVSYGDLIVLTAGTPFVSGTTNMMMMKSIGDVLVRGFPGKGQRIHGKVARIATPEGKKAQQVKGCILVIGQCDASYLPFLQESIGIILHNRHDDEASEKWLIEYAEKQNKPYLTRADAAGNILKKGQLITLDPQKGLVFKGIAL